MFNKKAECKKTEINQKIILIGRYLERNMEGCLYSINHFKLNYTPGDFSNYEGYNFVDYQNVIVVNQA